MEKKRGISKLPIVVQCFICGVTYIAISCILNDETYFVYKALILDGTTTVAGHNTPVWGDIVIDMLIGSLVILVPRFLNNRKNKNI